GRGAATEAHPRQCRACPLRERSDGRRDDGHVLRPDNGPRDAAGRPAARPPRSGGGHRRVRALPALGRQRLRHRRLLCPRCPSAGGMTHPCLAPTTPREAPPADLPLGRRGREEDIAACVLYLLSDDSAFVTGASYVLDGGLTAGR